MQVSLAVWSAVLGSWSSRLVNLLDHSKPVLPAFCFHRSQFIGVGNYHCISFGLESGCDCGIHIYPRAVKHPCHTVWTQPAWITGTNKTWASQACLFMVAHFWSSKCNLGCWQENVMEIADMSQNWAQISLPGDFTEAVPKSAFSHCLSCFASLSTDHLTIRVSARVEYRSEMASLPSCGNGLFCQV